MKDLAHMAADHLHLPSGRHIHNPFRRRTANGAGGDESQHEEDYGAPTAADHQPHKAVGGSHQHQHHRSALGVALPPHRPWFAPSLCQLEANSSPDMSTNALPLRQIVDEGLDDLLTVVLELKRKRTPASKLGAERAKRDLQADGPCWRLAYHGKLLSDQAIAKRRLAKRVNDDAPAGGAAYFQGVGHQAAVRAWVERLGAPRRSKA